MANSVNQSRNQPTWPLGFIQVTANGTPVGLMSLVDANNTMSPNYVPAPGNPGSEYTPRFRSIWFQGQGNNAAVAPNTGNVYIIQPGNGSNNKADLGAIVGIIPAGGGTFSLPLSLGSAGMQISPYAYKLDADVNGEGAIVVGVQPQGN